MTETPPSSDSTLMSPDEVAAGQALLQSLRAKLGQILLGQDELLDLTVIAMAARGHVLLEGLPGLGKTELVKALGRLLGIDFKRIQFTPDLLPSDVTGGPVLQEENGRRTFVFQEGPLFANIVLADEINRASPKTQSALLEAIQERNVTVLGTTHPLPNPFFVLATQNPIELEGTYPLPEAQLDRFLFKVDVPSVGADVVTEILKLRRRGTPPDVAQALTRAELDDLFDHVDRIFLPDAVAGYIARLTEASHPDRDSCPDQARGWIRYGASPRAAISIAEACRASALLDGRPNVDFADVDRVAIPAMAHRMVLDHTARLSNVTGRDVVRILLDEIEAVDRKLHGDLV